jgi:hypothetical protein
VAGEQPPPRSAGEQLEADVSAIEYLARVGPSRYGPDETLTRLKAAAQQARERYETTVRAGGGER